MRRWTQEARVEHARTTDVPRVFRFTGDLVLCIDPCRRVAHHSVLGDGAEYGFLVERTRDLLALREGSVCDSAVAVTLVENHAVLNVQSLFRDSEVLGGQLH